MLQFITHPSELYSIPEEVQMALEGGCRWIQLRMKDASDAEVREVAQEIIPMCRENSAFLVLDDRVELARELGVHGVHLGREDMPPAQAREFLGPEAIIGVTANTAADILALRGVDVDYVGLGPYRHTTTKKRLAPVLGPEGCAEVIAEVRRHQIDIPIVAIGGIGIGDIETLLACHVNGVAVSGAIINAENPVAYTSELLKVLEGHLRKSDKEEEHKK